MDTNISLAISSTPEDLEPYREAAGEVARELGFRTVVFENSGHLDEAGLDADVRRITGADLLLALVGWRRGALPDPELGGDSRRSWTAWEVHTALRHQRPVVVLMAGDSWPEDRRETDPVARARLLDFRGELGPLATFFGPDLDAFRDLVRRELERHQRGEPETTAEEDESHDPEAGGVFRPRSWRPPELPERPYPVLLPYEHPHLLAGRERELAELERRLRLPVPVLGLYAASGAGKSSLILGGLVPALRAAGRGVAVVRHPGEPGLAGRLIGDLLTADEADVLDVGDGDHPRFVKRLLDARDLTGAPPVLVLDQFEDLFRQHGTSDLRRVRALTGMLLAASVQRRPGCDGPLCHWLLAYRREFHGEIVQWLGDVLREARGLGLTGETLSPREETLPHDLAEPGRFHAEALAPLARPPAEADDPVDAATRVFLAVIETPLAARKDDGTAQYPWSFADDGAARLARAFGGARVARPRAPLVPELQVVLAHLMNRQGHVIEVPEDPGEMIEQALEDHLRRALDDAFPGRGEAARLGRTRALLALRELADAHGRRGQGWMAETLARAIGREGRDVLEKLATPATRIVIAEKEGEEWIYALSHDSMAAVLVRVVDEKGGHAGLGVDTGLLELRRFVALKSELYAAGEVDSATDVPARSFRGVDRHAEALLWGKERRRWWQACRERQRSDQRRRGGLAVLVALVLAVLAVGVWHWTHRWTERRNLLAEVSGGQPETAFAALHTLMTHWGMEPDDLRERLRQREGNPLDVLERGIGGIDEADGREAVVLQVAELALPLITEDAPEDPVRIASLVWALDFFAPKDEWTLDLRNRALGPLRRKSPRPPLPEPGDPGWADIPAGSFQRWDGEVTLSAFRMMTHEVTHAEFRRLFPDSYGVNDVGKDDHPAAVMSWYEAYTYAAWIGGRLPTEAEWEYAARAACDFDYCKSDGSRASVADVAWSIDNAMDPESGEPTTKRVGQLEANPWGLYDVYGNVWEFTVDWHGPDSDEDRVDPPGPVSSTTGQRTGRGGGAWQVAKWATPTTYIRVGTGDRVLENGLRVVLVDLP